VVGAAVVRYIAFDPGKTTGVAMLDTSSDDPPVTWQLPAMEAVAMMDDFIDHECVVVCETFSPRPGVRTWQPDALETIGALRYLTWTRGADFQLQTPAAAMSFATNDKLRRAGWWSPTTGGHVNDALRHMLLAVYRNGERDYVETLGRTS
jgi:hypothetical protein